MKIAHFPYLMIDSSWGSTINIFNSGFSDAKIKISIRRGQRKEEQNITIAINNRYNFSESMLQNIIGIGSDPFSVSIMCYESITILCGMYFKGSTGMDFFNIMPESNMIDSPSCLYCGNGVSFDTSLNMNLYKFYGNPEGKYLKYIQGCIVDFIFSYDGLNNISNPMVIGDCCREDGIELAGHPPGTHIGIASGGGLAFDFNYPRYDGGYTFYRPIGASTSSIISNDGIVLDNYFDSYRFQTLIDHLRSFFPETTVRVDTRIKTLLESKYGVRSFIQGDPAGLYGHDNHCHISLGNKMTM